MHPWRRTLILTDGGLASLIAATHAREAATLAGITPDTLANNVVLHAFVPQPEAVLLQRKAAATQAEVLGLGWCGTDSRGMALPAPQADEHERECIELFGAALLAARLGCESIVWPATAGTSDSVNIDRLASINDRALVAARFASITSQSATATGIVIDTPFAELSDQQLADLALDAGVPLQTCWWWTRQPDDPVVEQERNRWNAALQHAGWGAMAAV